MPKNTLVNASQWHQRSRRAKHCWLYEHAVREKTGYRAEQSHVFICSQLPAALKVFVFGSWYQAVGYGMLHSDLRLLYLYAIKPNVVDLGQHINISLSCAICCNALRSSRQTKCSRTWIWKRSRKGAKASRTWKSGKCSMVSLCQDMPVLLLSNFMFAWGRWVYEIVRIGSPVQSNILSLEHA